jgi:hypothetical protein
MLQIAPILSPILSFGFRCCVTLVSLEPLLYPELLRLLATYSRTFDHTIVAAGYSRASDLDWFVHLALT